MIVKKFNEFVINEYAITKNAVRVSKKHFDKYLVEMEIDNWVGISIHDNEKDANVIAGMILSGASRNEIREKVLEMGKSSYAKYLIKPHMRWFTHVINVDKK